MRRPSSLLASIVVGLTIVGAGACATTAEGGAAGPRAAEFAAAEVGNAWTYKITPGPEEPQAVRYVSRDDRGFYVDDRGGRLMPRSDGLYDGERFLLKEPVVAGATWIAVQKGPRPDLPGVTEQYRIVATDVTVTVPAGTFTGCVEVEAESPTRDPETGHPATILMRWVWAKQTGMVRLQQLVLRQGDKAPLPTATMELVSFTPASASSATP
jgi:hypothetical protein